MPLDASLAAAPQRLAALSDSDARAEVMRLTAGIDGHTGVHLGEAGFHLYAMHLYSFGDDVVVIAASDPALFGAKVLSIDGVPISAAAEAVAPDSPFDNSATAEIASAPSLARIDEPFWTTVLDHPSPDGGQTLYLQYNEVVRQSGSRSINQLADDVDTTLSSGTITRLVVDLRDNPGGNDRTCSSLLRVLTTHPVLARPGALVVIIGRQTFSAAALFAAELDKQTNAVFIGEPTGGGPNVHANPRPLKLPNSGLVVEVSSRYFDLGGADDHRDAVVPDIAATSGLDDLLARRDPVLDAALALA